MKTYQIILLLSFLFLTLCVVGFFVRKKILSGSFSHENVLGYSNLALQVSIFFVAVFGYFYTVIPLYSKAVLEEEVAKSQIALKESTAKLEKTEFFIKNTQSVIKHNEAVIKEKQMEIVKLDDVIASQENNIKNLNNNLNLSKNELYKTKSLLNSTNNILKVTNNKFLEVGEKIDNLHKVAKEKGIIAFKDELRSCGKELYNLLLSYEDHPKNQIELLIKEVDNTSNCFIEKSKSSYYNKLLLEDDKQILHEKVNNISTEFNRSAHEYLLLQLKPYEDLVTKIENIKKNLPEKWSDKHNEKFKLEKDFIEYNTDLSLKIIKLKSDLINQLSL
jgi:hypothetical protein